VWVHDELLEADNRHIPFVEVREQGVQAQGGFLDSRQHIKYDEPSRDKCLVDLAQTLGRWHRGKKVRLQLLPEELTLELIPLLRNPYLSCTYQTLWNGTESTPTRTTLRPIKGGLFLDAQDIPSDALIQIRIECPNHSWVSFYESIDSVGIFMKKEQ
jgi:hypothetical protein